jgi:two-component system sensor histidine kinase LytS
MHYVLFGGALLCIAAVSGVVLVMSLLATDRPNALMFCDGMVFTACLLISLRILLDPDRVRAGQTDSILNLASKTLAQMSDGDGLNIGSAQGICEMLLPATRAVAVAVTDTQDILGYAGCDQDLNPAGAPIRTIATHATIKDGRMRIIRSAQEIGFPVNRHTINAAIIVPLNVSGKPVGTLKFYYDTPHQLNETQQSIAAGFGELLSTQVAASALDQQRKLATSMELKALQSQINPHFLFNTINTITSFIRTDPDKARELMRDFATFYRGTLENDSDLIPLSQELEQTQRYLHFEIARFGEDRLKLIAHLPENLHNVLIPAFLIQPLAENAVRHAMPAEGCLHITVDATSSGDDLKVRIADDGVGMSEERRRTILNVESHTGLGIAVRNINDRILGYYGNESYLHVESTQGVGTVVTLFLRDGCLRSTERTHGL